MEDIIKIGIAGNNDSKAGHQPLVSVGYPAEELKQDINFPVQIRSDCFIQFSQDRENIKYTYVANPVTVHSFGASRPGSLWVSITVAKGKRVTGYTPYTLLLKILEIFRENYMAHKADGSYEFKVGNYLRQPFLDFIESLTITSDNSGRYVEMTGDAIGCVSAGSREKMEEFFSDPQYNEFRKYSKIIVAEKIDGSCLPLQIPRPVNYNVLFDNRPIGSITQQGCRFRYNVPARDSYHEGVDVDFTLSDGGVSAKNCTIRIDENNEIVHVFPAFPEKVRTYMVHFDNPSNVDVDSLGLRLSTADGTVIQIVKNEEDGTTYSATVKDRDIASIKPHLKNKDDLDVSLDVKDGIITICIIPKPKVDSVMLNGRIPEPATLKILHKDGVIQKKH